MLEAGTSMSPKDAFLDGCRFAKLVETPNGNGILINGAVFLVQAPPTDPGSYNQYADWFVTALRQLPGIFTGNIGGKFGIVGGATEADGSNASKTTAA